MFTQKVTRGSTLLLQRGAGAGLRPAAMTSLQNQLRRLCLSSTSNPRPQLQSPLAVQFLTRSNSSAATATEKPKASDSKKASAKSKTKKKKKPLTELQQKAKESKAHRARLQNLKTVALTPPKVLPDIFYTLAMQVKAPEVAAERDPKTRFQKLSEIVDNLSSYEKQQITEQAAQNRITNKTAYEEFIKSHTPLEILKANMARKTISQLGNDRRRLLKDDRQLKRPMNAYLKYVQSQFEANDFPSHVTTRPEQVRYIAEQWKSLPSSKKDELEKEYAVVREEYFREYERVYGVPCPAVVRQGNAKSTS
ncbi:hypothetical protein N7452_009720 [Penicillium brevicompactum]|uniref:HMG box domain-containing protein n=1 Tax=Penicillium brevicompactum TaxID=5074 RepID=A0A9W9UCI7_PENBR|nr:hypothetical protein N7452_009720 [Penicillium brevicompactum]